MHIHLPTRQPPGSPLMARAPLQGAGKEQSGPGFPAFWRYSAQITGKNSKYGRINDKIVSESMERKILAVPGHLFYVAGRVEGLAHLGLHCPVTPHPALWPPTLSSSVNSLLTMA